MFAGKRAPFRFQALADVFENQARPRVRTDPACCAYPQRMARSISTMRSEISGIISARIEKEIAEELPQELADAIGSGHQRPQALRQDPRCCARLRPRETSAFARMIFERFQIDGVDLFFLCRRACRIPGRFFRPASRARSFSSVKSGRQKAVAPGVVRGRLIKIRSDERPDIQADDIEQTEAGAVGQADQRAGERVDFFDGEIAFHRELLNGSAEEAADAVGDEVRRILARHHAFAQAAVAEVGTKSMTSRIGFRAGNQLHQVQVARRIEEVRAQEMAGGSRPRSLRRSCAAECRWCWWKGWCRACAAASTFSTEPRLMSRFSATASMIQSQSASLARSSSKLPGVIKQRLSGSRKIRRDAVWRRSQCRSARRRSVGLIGKDDIEQNGRNAGVGEMRGDARTHGSGAENGNTTNGSHTCQGDSTVLNGVKTGERFRGVRLVRSRKYPPGPGLNPFSGLDSRRRWIERGPRRLRLQIR